MLGVLLYVYADDHNPPHVHALYGEDEVELAIDTGNILAGSLPGAKLRHAREWLSDHRSIALAAWEQFNP